jgi:FkbM family methyltransferase
MLRHNENLIFDVGMHIGQDTEFYLAKGFNVVAIEANPLLAQAAEQRFATYIQDRRLTVLNVGIAAQEGEFTFYVNEMNSAWSSFVKSIGDRGGAFHEIPVQCLPLEQIMSIYGVPYYLKVDIEGLDFQAIKSLYACKGRPLYVSVENGNGGLLDCLVDLGYDYFKFVNQANNPHLHLPNPAREGNFVEFSFSSGASGPFGEETPGEWQSQEQVAIAINDYWTMPDRDPIIHGWFDLHAKLAVV